MQQSLATDVAIERRQVPRRSTVLRVRCHCTTEQEFVQRYAADICARGMFLRTRQSLPVGARVRFELLLQSGRCALGGVGRVAWIREPDCEHDRAGGGGIAFERLRRGDRAVIERMDVLRGSGPSRFEQPEAWQVEPPAGADLAKTLFADLTARVDAEPGAMAFLSADLSKELGDGGWRLGMRHGDAERLVADLAEQLEPSSERDVADDADDEAEAEAALEPGSELSPEADVELVAAPPPGEPAAAHSTVRPSPLSSGATRAPAKALRSASAQVAARATSPLAAVNSPSAVYAVSADSAVSLALARSAVNAARVTRAPVAQAAVVPPPVAQAPANVSVVTPEDPVVPAPLRRKPVAPAPLLRKPVAPAPLRRAPVAVAPAVNSPPAVPAAPPIASLAPVTPVSRRRGSTVALATALTTIILLATAVAYLSLTDQLPRVLHAVGL